MYVEDGVGDRTQLSVREKIVGAAFMTFMWIDLDDDFFETCEHVEVRRFLCGEKAIFVEMNVSQCVPTEERRFTASEVHLVGKVSDQLLLCTCHGVNLGISLQNFARNFIAIRNTELCGYALMHKTPSVHPATNARFLCCV